MDCDQNLTKKVLPRLFKSVLIDDPKSELSIELKKETADERKIVDLVTEKLGLTQAGKQKAVCYGCDSEWRGKSKGSETAGVDDPSFEHNPWGLYHTSGNVYEWVQDCWHEDYTDAPREGHVSWGVKNHGGCSQRVFRGGSWGDAPGYARSADRSGINPGSRNPNIGFRLAQD